MLYYKVKREADNTYLYNTDLVLVGSELFTEGERRRYKIPFSLLEETEVSQRKTFWCFGCRFAE